MTDLDRFLNAEHEIGRFDSPGEFTVDLFSLRRKVGSFLLAEPCEYLLKLVQAGVGARAQQVLIKLGRMEATIRLERPEGLDLVQLRQALENPQKCPEGPLRDLAQGITGAALESRPVG